MKSISVICMFASLNLGFGCITSEMDLHSKKSAGDNTGQIEQDSTTTFPGETNFTFSGWLSAGVPMMNVCSMSTSVCHISQGDLIDPIGHRVFARMLDQVQAGAAIRGDISNQDPNGTAVYHSIEFDLNTQNFFSQNPGAHIVIAPRALLPYQVNGVQYNNYPAFPIWPGTQIKVPYAYGDGVIIGSVPCKTWPGGAYLAAGTDIKGIAQEIFLRASVDSTHDTTACAPGQLTGDPQHDMQAFEDNSTYRVKVLVKQSQCPGGSAPCRWIGYRFKKVTSGAVFGAPPTAKGGLDTDSPTEFIDDIAQVPSFGEPKGWTALQPADYSSWYIAHVFTSQTSSSWSFQVQNLQVTASNTLPTWWTASTLP